MNRSYTFIDHVDNLLTQDVFQHLNLKLVASDYSNKCFSKKFLDNVCKACDYALAFGERSFLLCLDFVVHEMGLEC